MHSTGTTPPVSTRLGVRTPSAASHAHHPFEFAGLFLRVPVNICLDVLRRELELLEKRCAHVGVRKYAKKVLGVELIAAKLICVLRGTLQQFDCLLTESVGRIERVVAVVDKGILVFPMTGIGNAIKGMPRRHPIVGLRIHRRIGKADGLITGQPSCAGLTLALLLDGEDRLGSCFEPCFRYWVTAGIGETIGTICDLLQRALNITDALVVHVMQRLVDLLLRRSLRLVFKLLGLIAVLLLSRPLVYERIFLPAQ